MEIPSDKGGNHKFKMREDHPHYFILKCVNYKKCGNLVQRIFFIARPVCIECKKWREHKNWLRRKEMMHEEKRRRNEILRVHRTSFVYKLGKRVPKK
jgi:hypothetical protein